MAQFVKNVVADKKKYLTAGIYNCDVTVNYYLGDSTVIDNRLYIKPNHLTPTRYTMGNPVYPPEPEPESQSEHPHGAIPSSLDYDSDIYIFNLLPEHRDKLCIDPNIIVSIGKSIFCTTNTILSASDLDTGTAFVLGSDYYVYICDPSNGDDREDVDEVYKISLNSTCPDGWNESNSRKIGGFHYGHIRCVSLCYVPIGTEANYYSSENMITPVEYGTNWAKHVVTGIIPNSVWTLLHRPKCSPEGMVYLGNGLWGDIYLSSKTDTTDNYYFQSKKHGLKLMSELL